MLAVLGLGLGCVIATLGAVIDARTGRIPNWLTLSGLAVAAPIAFVTEASADGARAGVIAAGGSLLGALVCGLPPLLAFVRGSLGGGDVKLLAAVGALLGPRLGFDAEFYAFLIGALYVPARWAWSGVLLSTALGILRLLANPLRPVGERVAPPSALRMRIRFGPAIGAGTVLAIALAPAVGTGA
jgi:prepilin peptidase CpaA